MFAVPSTSVSYQLSKRVCLIEMMSVLHPLYRPKRFSPPLCNLCTFKIK